MKNVTLDVIPNATIHAITIAIIDAAVVMVYVMIFVVITAEMNALHTAHLHVHRVVGLVVK